MRQLINPATCNPLLQEIAPVGLRDVALLMGAAGSCCQEAPTQKQLNKLNRTSLGECLTDLFQNYFLIKNIFIKEKII
jgi:hypothetical protein